VLISAFRESVQELRDESNTERVRSVQRISLGPDVQIEQQFNASDLEPEAAVSVKTIVAPEGEPGRPREVFKFAVLHCMAVSSNYQNKSEEVPESVYMAPAPVGARARAAADQGGTPLIAALSRKSVLERDWKDRPGRNVVLHMVIHLVLSVCLNHSSFYVLQQLALIAT
jgi:hypothetical protein